MENLKIKVNSEAESREVQELLFSIGRTHDDGSKDHYQFCFGKYPHFINCEDEYISASRTGYLSYDEITLPELREMVHQEQDEPFLTPETTLNDQYAEIEQVRQAIKVKSGSDSDHALDSMSFGLMGAGAAQPSGGVDVTLSQRQSQYGCYEDVAHVTQQILSALRIGNYDELPAPMKESLHMIASKMARIVNGDPEYPDNWHDIGGYAKLIEKLIEGN